MKRFIYIISSLIIILCLTIVCNSQKVAAYSVQYNETESYTYDDINTLIELIEEQSSNMMAAQNIITGAKHLGYENDHDMIQIAQAEYAEARRTKQAYQRIYDDLIEHWNQKEEEYPVATYIWSYFKNKGYSNQVCAGILGNMMTEAGGDTLDIQWDAQTDSYYGICQWSKTYSDVWGASLEDQCKYLNDTIEYDIDIFGPLCYKKGFNYESFIAMTNSKDVALAFAKSYERCSSSTYTARQDNAVTAYNYFIG